MSEGTTAAPATSTGGVSTPTPSTEIKSSVSKPGIEVISAQKGAPTPSAETGKAGKPGEMTPGEMKEAVARLKLAIRGQEQEFDLANPDHVKRIQTMAQKGEAAEQKFQEAAYMRKQAEDFIRLLKTNPESVLGNPAVGLDVQKWAEDFLYRRLEESKKTPEQRQHEKELEELKAYREKEKLSEEEKKKQAFESAKEQYKQNLTTDIVNTLVEHNLPKSTRTVERMAKYILQAKQNGWDDVKPKDVVDMVREDYIQEHNELLGQLPAEELVRILNADVRKKLREAELASLKGVAPTVPAAEQKPSEEEVSNRFKKGLKKHEFRKMIDDRIRNLG